MSVNLINKETCRVIGIHIICPFDDMVIEMTKAWNLLKSRLDEINGRTDSDKIIGFYPQLSEDNDKNRCHYFIGVEVMGDSIVPTDMFSIEIPSHHYVSYLYKGALNDYVNQAYSKVHEYINEHEIHNNVNTYVLEVKNINNDLNDRLREDNEIELMIPVIIESNSR
ncbi:AraC family transcriptional regulator [Paenibacillus albiflavus]|uniref:AraC family transcriptional regulator n=1 Tax=Paenibacillus albiflavus TaxID=2545760 RepID=A0A4R4DX42_9BACL|nr:GyrI-like domain-containing protein [Paenibacillus albiflavus]TCZ69296.1 AraC family transcriptional regulator [Paenibacillus albiflavus]